MHILHIRVSNTQKQINPVYDSYKNNINNIFNRNMDNIMTKTIYTKFWLLKQSTLIMQSYILQKIIVLQLLKDFGQAANRGDEHFIPSIREKSSFRLLPSIVPPYYFANSTRIIGNIK